MALELYRAFDCLSYVGPDPALPALNVKVREPLYRVVRPLTVPIDTGFAGYLLTTKEVYNEVGTAELPSEGFGVYMTMAGPITLRRAHITVLLSGVEIDSYAETPLYGPGRPLIGRRLLSHVNVALLGLKGESCLLKPEGR